jgi:hypothetical protein
MTRPYWIAFSLMLVLGDGPGAAESSTPSYYLIGNSLTNDTVPSRLDGDTQWHIDCGKSLPYIFHNPAQPCVKSSLSWPEALEQKAYDFVSVQVHYGSTLPEDLEVITQWIEMQPTAIIIIHSGWARAASQAEEYAVTNDDGPMMHSPAYLQGLLSALRKRYPERIFRETHAQDLLARIASDIADGKGPFNHLQDLYRDDIHLHVVTGRYLMHNAMRHAMGQPRSAVGFEKLPPTIKIYLDAVLDTLGEH